MASSKGGTAERVRGIIEPIANDLGLDIWDVRFIKEGASWFLRIFIDKPDGITIDDCEAMSRAIDKPLDDADPISESYYLEVSSPGLGRELTRKEHFEMMLGEDISVKLIRPLDGAKDFEGKLVSFENDIITIATESGERRFKKSETAKVRLNDDKDI